MIIVKVLTADEFREIAKEKDEPIYDRTLKDRIKYFDYADLSRKKKKHFITLLDNDKIIGVCHIAEFEYDTNSDMSIVYFSIDPEYRGKGYTKLMAEKLMELCKKENIVLGTSSWTVPGFNRLRSTIQKYAKKHGVEFVDNNELFDRPWMYDSKMKHIKDMSDEERKKHDDLRKQKYIKSFNVFEYNTGLYKIYATQTYFNFNKVDYFYETMNDGKYKFFSNEGKIAGYIVKNKYYISEGHHRMFAALKYWKKHDDYSIVDKLIKNGIFVEKDKVPNNFYKKFPIKKI